MVFLRPLGQSGLFGNQKAIKKAAGTGALRPEQSITSCSYQAADALREGDVGIPKGLERPVNVNVWRLNNIIWVFLLLKIVTVACAET